MPAPIKVVLSAVLAARATSAQLALDMTDTALLGAQFINFWRLDQLEKNHRALVQQYNELEYGAAYDYNLADHGFTARWFRQPLDHFDPTRSETFLQRYWVNDRYYQPGGSSRVIVLDGGETDGANRLPFLDTGIVDILANATGALGVVLEHRYYGRSIPVLNFTTDALRFLNNAQSAADSANFMANVRFEGISEDLTAPGTPWIYYGGSYAGARAAHMRILYPDLTFGAIASSAVTHAAVVYWEYFEPIRLNAPADCIEQIQSTISVVDQLIDVPLFRKPLKALFGLQDLEHDDDFAALLKSPLSGWQGRNWDPAVGSTRFSEFCAALGGDAAVNYPTNMTMGGFEINVALLNYATWIKKNVVSRCPEGETVEQCFGTYDSKKYSDVSVSNDWRLWSFQVCTEWGYFQTAPPAPEHPRIVSRRITLEYVSKFCALAFPPGDYYRIPALPDVDGAVNSLGDFALAADRLAFIDGTADPWMPATPHSWYAKPRNDTILRPFKEIKDAVHHWDENGLPNPDDEPRRIREIHQQEVGFVKAWLKEFNATEAKRTRAVVRERLASLMRLDILQHSI